MAAEISQTPPPQTPEVLPQGVDGYVIRLTTRLDPDLNRAARALAAVLSEISGVIEVAPGLGSVYFRFGAGQRQRVLAELAPLLTRDWSAATAPKGHLWQVPCHFGGPELTTLAKAANETEAAAIASLCVPLEVLAIGFAPGQPYLGVLPPRWDIPRRSDLTAAAAGDVTVAVRQIVLFAAPSPTGWHRVGQTHFRPFDAGRAEPFALRPGDRVAFVPVSSADYADLATAPYGGARVMH